MKSHDENGEKIFTKEQKSSNLSKRERTNIALELAQLND